MLQRYSWPENFPELEKIEKTYIDSGFDQTIIEDLVLKSDTAYTGLDVGFDAGT